MRIGDAGLLLESLCVRAGTLIRLLWFILVDLLDVVGRYATHVHSCVLQLRRTDPFDGA